MILSPEIILSLTLPLVSSSELLKVEKPIVKINAPTNRTPYIIDSEDLWIDSVNSSRTDKVITNKDVEFKIRKE